MNLLNLIEDQTSGYENLRALMRAVNTSSDAQLDLDGEPITLTYPEARFMMGKYKAYNKVGRQAEFIRDLGDARQFDLHMKQLRDLMQKQKDFRGSVPGERGVSGDTYPGQLEEISQSVDRSDPMKIGMLNWTRMLKAFDENRPTVDLEFDGQGQPLTVYRPQMQALFLKAKKMTNQQQQKLVQTLADRIETIEYIDYLRRKGIIPKTPAYNRPETDPKQMDLPFEAKKKESDELDRDTAIDPKVQRAFQIARGRQAAAGSDFEAFVRDEIQRSAEVQQELERVQADNQEQEQKIQKLSAAITQMTRAEPPAVAPAMPAAAPPAPAPTAQAEPKAEPQAEPQPTPQPVPQPIPRQQPSRPEPKAEPGQVRQVEPDTKVQVPEPKAKPEVPDNVIQFPGLQLPGTELGEPERRRRKAAESVEIVSGEFQGQRATIIESKRHFVTVDIQGFGRRVIHESRVAEVQTDINRFNIDRPMLPSGIAKIKYARDNDMYDDARMQESLRAGEYHVATVTLDNGDVKKFKVTSDEGYTDVIKNFYARQGRTVKKIDMDWSVQGVQEGQLDEVDRRGFLKGLGAISGISAAGLGGWSAGYTTARDRNKEWDHGFLDGFLLIPKANRKDAQIILDIVNQTSWSKNRLEKDLHNQQYYKQGYHEGEQTYKKMFPRGHWISSEDQEKFLATAKIIAKRINLNNIGEQQGVAEDQLAEKQDACYNKVKSRYKVWPSAYASGALVQCRKKGAANWGEGGKKKK